MFFKSFAFTFHYAGGFNKTLWKERLENTLGSSGVYRIFYYRYHKRILPHSAKKGKAQTFHTLNFPSTLFNITAFVATMMDEADMRSAAISGRRDQPREV